MSGLGTAVPMTDKDRMEASDGTTITIDDDGNVYFEPPTPAYHRKQDDTKFDQNLAETLDDGALADIANDVLDGVNADILSRSEFISNYNKGVDLLGLKLDDAGTARGNRTSISRIKNPSLLKACMRSQSMSRGQLLPAAGPCKVQTISGESGDEDELARKFENDFNYFLTDIDRGYYTDTDRMLFYRAFGGSAYKKVYRDPILGRPCSRFTSLDSLIVSEDATSLADALRKTNELVYSPVQVARMQAAGGWLDTELGQPMQNISPARRKVLESQGLSAATTRSQDISHTIYETYWSFCPEDYGFDDRRTEGGMPAPYRLVMDRDSRKVLALHRNWKQGDKSFREKEVFVKYGLVPGLGFLDYGFLHLIGNQTRVLTAIWQILVDHGMIANFPSGLKVKGVRMQTNELNPSLGEWPEVDIGGAKSIKDALMGLPYGTIDGTFISLMQEIQKDVDALSGTLDIPTGQGSTNTPVGTILALVEQQAQDLTAVQQRDHRAQRDELRLLRDLFKEHPDDLKCLQRNGSKVDWAEKVQEFDNMDLVPASDPNIPSQAHRILINQFLVSLAEKAPQLFGSNLQKVAERVLRSVGINDASDLLAPRAEFLAAYKQQQQGKPGPGAAAAQKLQMELPIKQAELQLEAEKLKNEMVDTKRKAAQEAAQETNDAKKTEADIQLSNQKIALEAAKLEHDRQSLQSEHARGVAELAGAGDGQDSPEQQQADLEKTKAQTFAAMGSGAMGFAKAGETTAQGARDTEDFENGTENGREVPPAAPKATGSLQQPKSKTTTSKRGRKAKPK